MANLRLQGNATVNVHGGVAIRDGTLLQAVYEAGYDPRLPTSVLYRFRRVQQQFAVLEVLEFDTKVQFHLERIVMT